MRSLTLRSLFALVLALLAGAALVAPARAADAYRYWGFYQLSGTTWGYATKGPAQVVPKDGAVDGWRFALVAGTAPRPPRLTTTFDQVCANTPAVDGKKRVGVVIDFGRDADAQTAGASIPAPIERCAQVPTTATSQQVLTAVTTVRDSKGLVCALDSYPATGCSDVVADAKVPAAAKAADAPLAATMTPSAAASTASSANDSGSSDSFTNRTIGLAAGAAVLAGLGALLLRARSRGGSAD